MKSGTWGIDFERTPQAAVVPASPSFALLSFLDRTESSDC